MSETYKDLEELIEKLEKIRYGGIGTLSLAKSLYLLALEIQKIKNEIRNLSKS